MIVLLYYKLHQYHQPVPLSYDDLLVCNSGIIPLGLVPYLLALQLGFSDIDSSWFHRVAVTEI